MGAPGADELPDEYRTVLVLRHYENLKFREIAVVIEMPEGTVKSRMAEALSRMSRLLKPMLAAQPPDNLTSPDNLKKVTCYESPDS